MTMLDNKCDVCGRASPVGVASSALTAMSFAFCWECLEHQAEDETVLAFTVWSCNGIENVNPVVRNDFMTWKDDRYWTMNEWWEEYGSKLNLDDMFTPPDQDLDATKDV